MEPLIQLDDLLAENPSIDDPEIQTLISRKNEFAELATEPKETVDNDAYKHQKIIQRFMKEYAKMIILHETGTGKSYLIGGTGEALRKAATRGSGVKHVLILVKGETQQIDVKKTLVCLSTGGRYLSSSILNAPDARSMRKNATRSLSEFYTIKKYGSFASKLRHKTDQEIIAEYSDYLIIIDEIHNLRIRSTIDPREPIPDNILNSKRANAVVVHKQIWRLTHLPQRIKVMGLSASPVINHVNEAISVFNLVLPVDRMIPMGTNMNTISIDQLNSYLSGHVSYVRALDTGAVGKKMGVPDRTTFTGIDGKTYESQLVTFSVKMMAPDPNNPTYTINNGKTTVYKGMQALSYERAYNPNLADVPSEDADLLEEGTGGLFLNERQCSLAVYPDGSWGKPGYDKYFEPTEDGWIRVRPERQEEFLPILRDITALSNYSIGYAHTINNLNMVYNPSFPQRPADMLVGITLMFGSYVEGSGLNYLGMVMENNGFERFNETTSIFESGPGGRVSYCSGSSEKKNVRAGFAPYTPGVQKRRFAMIAKDTPPNQISIILEAISSKENMHGEYISVIMISERAKEGISIDNTIAYMQTAGTWNPTIQYQARSRGFRSTSHIELLRERVDELIAQGYDEDRARQLAEISVYEWYMATIPLKSETSVDMITYRLSETKDRQFKSFMRKLKIISVDCPLHRKRNIRPEDKDGSPQCDYTSCDYPCFGDKFECFDRVSEVPVMLQRNTDLLKGTPLTQEQRDFLTREMQTTQQPNIETGDYFTEVRKRLSKV